MALPSSGSISMSQINTELGRSSTATITIDSAENGAYATINTCSSFFPSSGNPASISEWYSYNHNASCGGSCWVWATNSSGWVSYYDCSQGTYFDTVYVESGQQVCSQNSPTGGGSWYNTGNSCLPF